MRSHDRSVRDDSPMEGIIACDSLGSVERDAH